MPRLDRLRAGVRSVAGRGVEIGRSVEALNDPIFVGACQLERLWQSAPLQSFRKGANLVDSGAAGHPWYSVREGWACRLRDIPGQRSSILEFYLPGDVIGPEALFADASDDAVTAITPLAAISLSDAAVREALADPAVALFIASLIDQKRRRAERL